MTVRSVPIFLQAGSHPAEETRLMLGGMLGTVTGSFAGGVASADPAHGVIRSTDLAVTQNGTPNMSVNVAAGGAFIRGTLNANQGAYHVWNDGTVNLSISAADATNGRRDLVIAQVRDAAYSGATNDARITVVTGTPAASPADPSLASFPNALVLARITVAAGDTAINTADITDLRTVANQIGKIPTFNTSALATTAIPSPLDGQAYYLNVNNAGEGPYWFNGSNYTRPWHSPWGVVSSALAIAGSAAVSAKTVVATGASFTAVANRYYRATFVTTAIGTVSGDNFQMAFQRNNTAGATDFVQRFSIPATPFQTLVTSSGVFAPGAVTFTPVISFERVTGTGTASTGIQTQLVVQDVGPSGAPV